MKQISCYLHAIMTRTTQNSSFLHRDAGFLFFSPVDWCWNQLWGLPSHAKEAEPYWGFMFPSL